MRDKYNELNFLFQDWYFEYGIKGDKSRRCEPNQRDFFKGLVQSRCNVTHRDHKWYDNAYNMIIKVNDFANKTRQDDDMVQILLNCIVTGNNVPFNKKKNKKEWGNVFKLIHSDKHWTAESAEFRTRTGYTIEQLQVLTQILNETSQYL